MEVCSKWDNHRIMVIHFAQLFLCHFPCTSLGNVLGNVLMPVFLR